MTIKCDNCSNYEDFDFLSEKQIIKGFDITSYVSESDIRMYIKCRQCGVVNVLCSDCN